MGVRDCAEVQQHEGGVDLLHLNKPDIPRMFPSNLPRLSEKCGFLLSAVKNTLSDMLM